MKKKIWSWLEKDDDEDPPLTPYFEILTEPQVCMMKNIDCHHFHDRTSETTWYFKLWIIQ